MRVVFDTNVLVSGISKWHDQSSSPPRLLHLWDRGEFELGVSDWILHELEFALSKPYFQKRVDPELSKYLFKLIKEKALRIDPLTPRELLATHWQDDLILSTAVAFKTPFLVTGDRELLDLDHSFPFRIIHPNDFLVLIS